VIWGEFSRKVLVLHTDKQMYSFWCINLCRWYVQGHFEAGVWNVFPLVTLYLLFLTGSCKLIPITGSSGKNSSLIPYIRHGSHKKRRLEQFFVVEGTCSPSHCLTTRGTHTQRLTDTNRIENDVSNNSSLPLELVYEPLPINDNRR
jgi:hypothetical protein